MPGPGWARADPGQKIFDQSGKTGPVVPHLDALHRRVNDSRHGRDCLSERPSRRRLRVNRQ